MENDSFLFFFFFSLFIFKYRRKENLDNRSVSLLSVRLVDRMSEIFFRGNVIPVSCIFFNFAKLPLRPTVRILDIVRPSSSWNVVHTKSPFGQRVF
jgi:hypothetical protein